MASASERGDQAVTPGRRLRAPWRSRTGTLTAAFLAVALAGALWLAWSRPSTAAPSIVVLPFVNLTGDPQNEYFADGLTEEVIYRLSAIPGLEVIARTSSMHYKGSGKSLADVAGELDVSHVLEGSVRQADGKLRISARLFDVRSADHPWMGSYDYELRDVFRVQVEMAREVAQALALELGERGERLLVRRGTRDAEAYELYRRGRFFWNRRTREGHEAAADYFSRAIARDSSYADAYGALAELYLTDYQLNLSDRREDEAYERIRWAAERALALDDESADAHVSTAIALWWRQDWPGAERELRRAIDLNPSHATARSWYSLLLRGMDRGREAREQSRQAVTLDPFAVVVGYNDAWQCYQDRDDDCAIERFQNAVDIGAYPSAYRGLALVYVRGGRHAEALDAMRKAVELAPHRTDFIADLAYVQARAGALDSARRTLRQAKERPQEPFNVARAHVALGEADSAMAWLERSNWRWPHRAVASDPALDPLRSDPRFERLTARIPKEMGLR
jgi:TolB-like protein/Tfp pilus assembly protein PilF